MGEADATFAQVVGGKILRRGLAAIPVDEGENAAPRAARGDAEEPFGGGFGEARGEIGDDEEMIFFGNVSGLFVVFGDGGVFVAQVYLDDFSMCPLSVARRSSIWADWVQMRLLMR